MQRTAACTRLPTPRPPACLPAARRPRQPSGSVPRPRRRWRGARVKRRWRCLRSRLLVRGMQDALCIAGWGANCCRRELLGLTRAQGRSPIRGQELAANCPVRGSPAALPTCRHARQQPHPHPPARRVQPPAALHGRRATAGEGAQAGGRWPPACSHTQAGSLPPTTSRPGPAPPAPCRRCPTGWAAWMG